MHRLDNLFKVETYGKSDFKAPDNIGTIFGYSLTIGKYCIMNIQAHPSVSNFSTTITLPIDFRGAYVSITDNDSSGKELSYNKVCVGWLEHSELSYSGVNGGHSIFIAGMIDPSN